MKYDIENTALILRLKKSLSVTQISTITGIPSFAIESIMKKQAFSIHKRLEIKEKKNSLFRKYSKKTLTNKQAFDAIGTFKRGRELGAVLNTCLLPTLGISDIARYIVLYT
jgi:hypothetical protein